MAVTIKDIAKEAGVSFQAVSAVLNNTPGIRVSAEKREMILEIVERLGYQRNFGYNLMHNKPTNTAAIIVSMPRMAQEERLRSLVLELMANFNKMQIATYYFDRMSESVDENLKYIRRLIARGVEAFILIGSPFGHFEIQEELKARKRTFVSFDAPLLERNLQPNSLKARREIFLKIRERVGDDFRFMLPKQNGKSAIFLSLLKEFFPGRDLDSLWQEKVFELPRLDWYASEELLFKSGWENTEKLLNEQKNIRGFIFSSDSFALGCAGCLEMHGFTVGKDVFVSGFNADSTAKMQHAPIITAELPLEEVVEILIRESYSNKPFSASVDWKVIPGNTFFSNMVTEIP